MNLEIYQALINDTPSALSILSNTASYLYQELKDINWVGFYLLKENTLYLGPFMGKPACTQIPLSKGVCGKAAREKSTVRVDNVHEFEGHIACDEASLSEIVVPILINDNLIGVLDIDAPIKNRFTIQDEENLKRLVTILSEAIKKSNVSITL